jgi:predicted DCC family thiol-disulfide oxidoreductase YuxK
MIPIAMAPRSYSWTVIYDSDCGFCRWSLGWVLRLDRNRRLRPVALQSAEADGLLADLPSNARTASWHLVAPDGRRFSAGEGLPPLLRLLPGGRAPATLAAAAQPLTNRAYRLVADHRTVFGKPVTDSAKRRADELIAERSA